MPVSEVLGKTAGIVSLAAFIPYILAILRGETKPNRASWWIWSVVGCMLAASYYSSGASHTMWVPVSYLIGPVVTALLSLKFGEGGWTRFDRWCLGGAAASLLFWIATNEPMTALLVNLFIDFLGALPTIKKAYRDPKGEDRLAWTLFVTGSVLNLLAVDRLEFAILIYPLYMLFVTGFIWVLVLRRTLAPS